MSTRASGFDFRPRKLGNLPREWRALDASVARWVLAHGGPRELASAAGWASFADSQGHSALLLDSTTLTAFGIAPGMTDTLAGFADDPANRWLARPTETALAPFVLDGDAFYLRRNHADEVAIATRLKQRLGDADTPLLPVTDADLRELFQERWTAAEQAQRDAVRQVAGKRLFVLTGGPGTGKTSTVLRMLLVLLREHRARHPRQEACVRLCAPTGKAAQRLAEALRHGAAQLQADLPDTWQPLLQTTLAAETGTVHRLLGVRGNGQRPASAGEPALAADIVVVDEASMLDLDLLHQLLHALPAASTLVLVGDAEQLPAIGSGAALADLVRALDGSDAQVRLHHSFRAEQALVAINRCVRDGDLEGFLHAWNAAGPQAIRHSVHDARQLQALLVQWSTRLHDSLQQAGAFALHDPADSRSLQQALQALRQQQLLCAVREGGFGAVQANAALETQLQRSPALFGWQGLDWYPGRAVLVTRNDYSSGLFNGDVGLCLRLRDDVGRERLRVVFDPLPGQDQPRSFDPASLPPHEAAFALTVHKSQGSEYAHVAVVLPPAPAHALLNRQLLYTALSRGRQGVELWASEPALTACLATPLQRAGRLAERIVAAAPEPAVG